MSIHPTAVIDSRAELASNVEIGPFVLIEGNVQIGEGCRILAQAQIVGDTEIGAHCLVGRGSILGSEPQSIGFDPSTKSGVRIGERNEFREYVTVHRSIQEGGFTKIGDHNFLMTGSHAGHDVVMGDHNILANNCLLGGHVEIGDRTFLGGGSAFHQYIRVGDLCMVKGNSSISMDIPPFTMAHGSNQLATLNVVGLRRRGLDAEERAQLKRAFRLLCRGNLNLQEALTAAETEEWGRYGRQFLDFFHNPGPKGICRRA